MDMNLSVEDEVSLLDQRAETSVVAAKMLYEFALHTTQFDLHRDPSPQLASLLQSIFSIESVAIFDVDQDVIYQVGEWSADLEDLIRSTYFFESITDEPEIGLTRRVLRIGNLPIGAMMLRGEISPLTSSFIACLIAITFDRFHSLANVSRTESARQAEQLRTTVLDSLAHAYKTPLTAIRVATTGLYEMSGLTPAQSDLVQLIDGQASLLNDLTTRLLETAQIEARDLTLHTETIAVASLIENVVASLSRRIAGFALNIIVSRDDLSLSCDPSLLIALLTQYLDNAGKYAIVGSTITIQVDEHPSAIIFSVHNVGLVIPQNDHERIFDRYFRCADSASQISGTGVGLSIAKHAAHAHGGDVWVTSNLEQGTTFFASLPIIRQVECGI
jgi:two-component system sensor histidine kinase KdpD